ALGRHSARRNPRQDADAVAIAFAARRLQHAAASVAAPLACGVEASARVVALDLRSECSERSGGADKRYERFAAGHCSLQPLTLAPSARPAQTTRAASVRLRSGRGPAEAREVRGKLGESRKDLLRMELLRALEEDILRLEIVRIRNAAINRAD